MAKRISDEEWEREADRLMEEEYDKACQEGYQQATHTWIEAMLTFKFGLIDSELEAVIPNLMKMDPIERSRLILTRSREALLESQDPLAH